MKRKDRRTEKKDVKGAVRSGNSKWRKRRESRDGEKNKREETKKKKTMNEEGTKRKKENGWKREQKVGATNVAKSATIESNVGMCLLQGKGLNKTLTTIFTVNANCLLINSK